MTDPYLDITLEALAAKAVRFPLRGPLTLDEAWDGVALIDFAYRARLPLGKLRERRCQQAVDVIKRSGSPAAFRMMAIIRMAQYQVMMLRFLLGPESNLPTEDDIDKACNILEAAIRKRRAALARRHRARKKALDAA